MKKKSLWTTMAAIISVGALSLSLGACGTTNSASDTKASSSTSASKDASANKKDDAQKSEKKGFEEIPIGETRKGPLHIGAVYFQPVDMYPVGTGLPASQANMHIEADIHALANNKLGYAKDEYVPDCTVKYSIVDKHNPSNKVEGTFMQMNADDGPHYGANVKLDKAGEYTLTFTIYSPETNGWALHVDKATGVEGRFWTEPIKASFDWNYTVHQW